MATSRSISSSRVFHRLWSHKLPPGLVHGGDRAASAGDLLVTWLGTAGAALEHGGKVLLLDPFVSRPGLRRSVAGPLIPDEAAIRRHLPRADYIICTHSHFDHLMDIPALARSTGAMVVGSRSSCNYCRAVGLPESQLIEVHAPHRLQLGPFAVTLRPSLHVETPLGKPPLPGVIRPDARPPLRVNQFLNEETFGVLVETSTGETPLSLFHLGSARFGPETLLGLRCDVLTVALVGRQRTPGFTARLLANLRPRVVIPIHFDDLMIPLERELRAMRMVQLNKFLEEVRQAETDCETVVLDLMGSYQLTAE